MTTGKFDERSEWKFWQDLRKVYTRPKWYIDSVIDWVIESKPAKYKPPIFKIIAQVQEFGYDF